MEHQRVHLKIQSSTNPAAEVSQAYDQMALDYDSVGEEAFYLNQYLAYEEHLRRNKAKIPGRVLDLGCGTGIQLRFANKVARTAIGIDISKGLLHEAKKKLPDAHLLCADACDLPFRDGAFDAVISYGEVFSHIPSYSKAFSESARVLKPGGYFLFSVLNKWNIHTIFSPKELVAALKQRTGHWRTWECVFNGKGDVIAMDLKTFVKEELKKIGKLYKFEILDVEGIHISSLLIPLRLQYGHMNLFGKIFALLGKLDRKIHRIIFFREFGYTKIIVAKKTQ